MKASTYLKLYLYLTKNQKFSSKHAILNIRRIVHMSPEVFKAFEQWFVGKQIPNITINDVSFVELTEKEGMAPVRAFLMLDWISKDPESAMHYMAEERFQAPVTPLSEKEKKEAVIAMEKLRQKGAVLDVPRTMMNTGEAEIKEEEIERIIEEEKPSQNEAESVK